MASLLERLTGGAGTDTPIQVTVTHDLAPLNSPVLQIGTVVIASCLVIMLIDRAAHPPRK
jgi:hypothetical protein